MIASEAIRNHIIDEFKDKEGKLLKQALKYTGGKPFISFLIDVGIGLAAVRYCFTEKKFINITFYQLSGKTVINL